MSKNPKSIVISFRLSPLAIAKAIDGLKNYDKSADITKLSSIVKQTTLHGINYLTNALPWEPSKQSQIVVHNLTTQGKTGVSIEQSILGQQINCLENKQSEQSFLDKTIESNTKSVNSSVTDFSMPKELMQEIEEEEKDQD